MTRKKTSVVMKEELDSLYSLLTPNKKKLEAAQLEIKYLRDVEEEFGKGAKRESELRIENAKLKEELAACIKVHDENIEVCKSLQDVCRQIKPVMEKLVKALKFYADGNSWYRPSSCEGDERKNYNCSRLPKDMTLKGIGPDGLAGAVAREALKGVDKFSYENKGEE